MKIEQKNNTSFILVRIVKVIVILSWYFWFFRGVNDIAKRIEEEKSNWKSVADVFTSSQEVLRAKLRDYCEKLIYQDFQGHGRKIEELLWRKGFYEVFCAAKKLRKVKHVSKTC